MANFDPTKEFNPQAGYSGQPDWMTTLEERKKKILEELLEKAKVEKPDLTLKGVSNFVRSQYPFWSKNKIADYGNSLFFMIQSYLKERKEQTKEPIK